MAVIGCPTCSAQYRISDSKISEINKLRCKKCGTVFRLQDGLKAEDQSPSTSQSADLDKPQEDLSLDMNLGDMTLDFGGPADSSQEVTLAFGSQDLSENNHEDNVELHDHISAPLQEDAEQANREFSDFSFAGDNEPDRQETLSGSSGSLDFSFTAAVPEIDQEQEEDQEEDPEEEQQDEYQQEVAETISMRGISPVTEANLPEPSFDDHLSPPAISDEDISETFVEDEEEVSDESEEEYVEDEELSTCCIDSLAMGLSLCEICGRNLEGKDPEFAKELQQQRKQELKEALSQGDVQIGFSEEQIEAGGQAPLHDIDDFSDVEQALDALADGSFQEEIKKREAKKTVAKTFKAIGLGIVVVLAVVGGILWFLLPSSHEKLLSRYQQLQENDDPKARVELFLDATIEKDLDIFKRLTVIASMPNITYGNDIDVGAESEKMSLGPLSKIKGTLEQEIAILGEEIEEKEQRLKEYSTKDISPRLIQDNIKRLQKRLDVQQLEYDEKDVKNAKKLGQLRQELETTKQEIKKYENQRDQYFSAVDPVGKALYQNALRQRELLAKQQKKLESQIQQENTKYQGFKQDLDNEYDPKFSELEERIKVEKVRLEEARLLEDPERSPLIVLPKELERLTRTIIDKKEALDETTVQLDTALKFFPENANTIAQQQDAEFIHVSQYAVASIKMGDSSEQRVSIVLKRYQATLSDKTLQSDWLVEKIAQ